MSKPDQFDDGAVATSSDAAPASAEPRRLPPALKGDPRRPEIEEQLRRWYNLDEDAQEQLLRNTVTSGRGFFPEALVHISRHAFGTDHRRFNLAFEALAKVATPLLLSQAFGQPGHAHQDQAQTVLLLLFRDIKLGKVDFAERYFAGYAKKKAISLYRERRARIENKRKQIDLEEPSEELDQHPLRMPRPELLTLLGQMLDRLSPKQREVFIQEHVLEMTRQEIAEHHGVDVRTIYNWLKEAKAVMDFAGGEYDYQP